MTQKVLAKRRQHTSDEFVAPYCKVTAIVRAVTLDDVVRQLKKIGVPGITVTKVKGYGELKAFMRHDWLSEHARIEIFLPREQANKVARAIVNAAQTRPLAARMTC